jgi:GPH family glycoside/pentoside/hexuronide:cation symporter
MFDIVNDPIVGTLSDHTRTRWGRRRPWMALGSIVLPVSYWMLFSPSFFGNENFKLVYYMLCFCGVSFGLTCMNISVASLVPELTDDYDERSSLSAYRLAIGNLLGFCSLMVMTKIVESYNTANIVAGYRNASFVVAIIMGSLGITCFMFIREKFVFKPIKKDDDDTIVVADGTSTPPTSPNKYGEMIDENSNTRLRKSSSILMENRKFTDEFKLVLKNKAFLWLSGIWLCGPTALSMLQSALILYCKYIMKDASLITPIIIIVQVCSFASLPFWLWLSKKKGKRFAYNCAAAGLITFTTGLTFNSNVEFGFVCAAGIGCCLICVYLIPYSMLPDCIEVDEYMTGRRREGIYVGFFGFMMKTTVTLAMGVSNVLLKVVGYVAPKETCGSGEIGSPAEEEGAPGVDADDLPAEQNWATRKVIRFLVGAGPACFFLLAMFCVSQYPITKDYHDDLLKKIEEKKKLGLSHEPGTVKNLRARSSEGEDVEGVKLEFDKAKSHGVSGSGNEML